MGRYQTTFPYTFNNAPGDQPANRIDQDFEAVNDGLLTIRAQELSDGNDYNVLQDDEYSYFVCKGAADFQIIPPVAPPTGFGFFFSNETRQETIEIGVTLCCTVAVGTAVYTNPVLNRDFLPYFLNVKGGLVQYDGNQWNFYPLFYASSGGGSGGVVVVVNVPVSTGDSEVTVTHGFNQPGLTLNLLPLWNTVVWQTAQTDTAVTFMFANPAPADLDLTCLVYFP